MIIIKAKKEIRNFLIGCLIWILLFRVITGEKIIFDFAHIGPALLIIVAVIVFVEYRERKKIQNKSSN